jgi:Ca2+-transporting ATPase
LLETVNLKIQESTLTGEPEPDEKDTITIENPQTPIADRSNMAYMGTVVTMGRATAIVVETGMRTELGKIASIMQAVRRQLTPLQKRLDHLGKILAVIGCAISAVIILTGLIRGDSIVGLLLAGISVAVAVIPEGLPAVVTITLAIGSQRMLKRHTLIRKLPAVETLGSVTVICTDKTGTLTQNKMTVVCINAVTENIPLDTKTESTINLPEISKKHCDLILSATALCNDAHLSDNTSQPGYIGDPTETALVAAAHKYYRPKNVLDRDLPRIAEIPFDSNRKRMTTVHRIGSRDSLAALPILENANTVAFTKGALDSLLELSDRVLLGGNIVPLSDETKKEILASNEAVANKGIRILGVAFSYPAYSHADFKLHQIEQNLIFLGFLGLADPPRPEVKDAVDICKKAGIRPVMITGDHPLTARSIASELGILGNGKIITAVELEKLSREDLRTVVNDVSVYARVSPEHKLQIVEALQDNGQIVAVTGDGVNDAPALKKANIGVAMGITGTDVSKDASDMVLLDDNFASIVNAVQEGRIIYDNIKKFVMFSVGGNIGKVIVMLFGPFLWKSLPLVPLQVLWLNLLTDGLLGLGLGVEHGEGNIMKRSPLNPNESIFARGAALHVFLTGLVIGTVSLIVGGMYSYNSNEKWQTMLFTTIAFGQVWQVLSVRSTTDLFFHARFFSNRTLISMVCLTLALQGCAIYIPFLQKFLLTKPLNLFDMTLCFAAGGLVFVFLELEKARRKYRITK